MDGFFSLGPASAVFWKKELAYISYPGNPADLEYNENKEDNGLNVMSYQRLELFKARVLRGYDMKENALDLWGASLKVLKHFIQQGVHRGYWPSGQAVIEEADRLSKVLKEENNDETGDEHLYVEAYEKHDMEMIKYLGSQFTVGLKKYADLALFAASMDNNLKMAKYFISIGADPNATNEDGDTTCVEVAIESASLACLRYLVLQGANFPQASRSLIKTLTMLKGRSQQNRHECLAMLKYLGYHGKINPADAKIAGGYTEAKPARYLALPKAEKEKVSRQSINLLYIKDLMLKI